MKQNGTYPAFFPSPLVSAAAAPPPDPLVAAGLLPIGMLDDCLLF